VEASPAFAVVAASVVVKLELATSESLDELDRVRVRLRLVDAEVEVDTTSELEEVATGVLSVDEVDSALAGPEVGVSELLDKLDRVRLRVRLEEVSAELVARSVLELAAAEVFSVVEAESAVIWLDVTVSELLDELDRVLLRLRLEDDVSTPELTPSELGLVAIVLLDVDWDKLDGVVDVDKGEPESEVADNDALEGMPADDGDAMEKVDVPGELFVVVVV
jgi:hypothetical protein